MNELDRRGFVKGAAALGVASMVGGAKAGGQSMAVPRENWSGTYHYHTDKVFQPTTVVEVQDAVRASAKVRGLGTRHSFNGIADSNAAQISMLGLKDVTVDAASKMARVGAGARLGDLAVQIDKQGWALHNLPSLPHISIAGCCATGTHGSGAKNGNIATAVRSIEFVTADGNVHTLTRGKDAEFAGAVVGLGAPGIVTHMTLDLHPRFDMAQVVYRDLPFAELEHHLLDIMGAAYSVSLFTHWQNGRVDQVWLKKLAEHGVAPAATPMFYGAKLETQKVHPADGGNNVTACTDQGNIVGPWYQRLPHFKLEFTPSVGHEIQSEFFVPLEHGYEAIRAVETLRDEITPHLIVTELRAIAADDLWMSMAYQRTSLAIHFTWKAEEAAVMALLPKIEAKLAPFGARPHWAKVYTTPKATLRQRYPKMGDFEALVKKHDPQGKFINAFLRDDVLG